MPKFRSPLGFTSGPVTFVVCAVYIAIGALLLYTHHVLPPAPLSDDPVPGVNLTDAWRDLKTLSSAYHPYNSLENDKVHKWLLSRVHAILKDNGVEYASDNGAVLSSSSSGNSSAVTVFDDLISNASFTSGETSVYFEGTNIMIYIRGSKDEAQDWWRLPKTRKEETKPHGVLVNAHYDSVSTGLGATDDGVGVICILQLIKHFTTPGQQPKRGIVALLNNGEEDFLNGAYAFTRHPLSRFPDTFLNLEGAGAGGRAILFRSTDVEVTRKYKQSPYPFGNVVASDSFDRGLIRSQSDYIVFNGQLGMRGLDVAFFEPRSHYHTVEDSARATSKAAMWHMLSGALATLQALSSDTRTDFNPRSGSKGVWFDLFGRVFGVLRLQTMFALSVTLLVVTPIFLLVLILLLRKFEKWYLFATYAHSNPLDPHAPDETAIIRFGGWKGWTRFPIAAGLASLATVGLAFVVTGANPLILYSSQYSVWTMFICAWFVVAWFFMRGADAMRPSALHRAHSMGWLFVVMWALLVASTVAENVQKLAGVYFFVVVFAASFAALTLCYLEFFALPKTSTYVQEASHAVASTESNTPRQRSSSFDSSRGVARDDPASSSVRHTEEEATETTSLLGKRRPLSLGGQSRQIEPSVRSETFKLQSWESRAYGEEQKWSGTLPSWLWVVEFLLLAPITLVFVGQIALFMTSALHQTPADGSSALFIYLCFAGLTCLLLLPTAPFLHRIPSRVPTFLVFIFLGTLAYNLLAFPFSEQSKLKVFFRQEINLETGANQVTLLGLDGYVQQIVAELPSAAGKTINCSATDIKARRGLVGCHWEGLAPNVGPTTKSIGVYSNTTKSPYEHWLSVNATSVKGEKDAISVYLSGKATRSCRLEFDEPIADFDVKGSSSEETQPKVPPQGTKQLRLWHREWNKPWEVKVRWNESISVEKKKTSSIGRAICLWNDESTPGTIPALDEIKLNMPLWSIVTKLDDGLVLGTKDLVL